MAYVQLGKIGSGIASSLSVFNNLERAYSTEASGQSEGSNTLQALQSIYRKIGFNLNEAFIGSSVNQVISLMVLNDGTYIGAKLNEVELNVDYGSNYLWRADYYRFRLDQYNSNGTIKRSISPQGYQYTTCARIIRKSDGAIINGTTLISICVDDENRIAHWKLYASDGASRAFEMNTINRGIIDGVSESLLYEILSGSGVEYDPDPWANAGYAGIGGGEGSFDFNSDVIGLPSIPSVDSVSSGFLQLFSGGLSKIIELSKYMWSTDFFDSIVKLTANPIEIIMGLYMYPFVVPATSQKYVRAGNVITNISMNVPDSQIFEIDCGVFPVPQFYGAYLDYEPFSKCEIYLPYCGTFNLSMDDITGKELNVRYRVDLLTGLCVAYVIIDGTVKYNFTGSCAVNIPISSRSFENLYNSIIGLVGSMFSGGSFSSPSVGSVSGVVTSGKNQITHGGIASGNAGYLGVQKPYLIFNVPRVAIPKGLNKYTGYPIFATYKLSDLEGYTEVEEIHLENMGTATKEEIDRIVSLLKGGVIL